MHSQGNLMKLPRRNFLHLATGAAALPAVSRIAWAQAYPTRPVRLLVGFAPGGPNDIVARLVGERFSAIWGKPVVIDNVTGASGNLAADRVAKSAPDGYTLLMAGAAQIVVNLSLYQKMAFDPTKDLTPISQLSSFANILAVHNDVPAKTVQDLIALARKQPGELTFASGGVGTSNHLAGELFKSMASIDIRHVPYRSLALAVPDLLAGRVSMAFLSTTYLQLVREGKLRGFAVSSLKCAAAAPDLPTMAESGFPDFDATGWFGLMAPAGTSPAVVDKIQRDAVSILSLPELRKKLDELGLEPIGNTPAEFAAAIKSEISQWAKVIKEAGIKQDE
jgi:tripartite-type tricarboxylate transporter receptor subunit TctC